MSAIHHFIINQKARALSEGIKIVRDILKSNPFPNGFTTAQLFEVAVQKPPPPDFPVYRHTANPPKMLKDRDRFRKAKNDLPGAPTHPEHPIRSLRFLKSEVLPLLVQKSEIKKVRQLRITPLDPMVEAEKGKKGNDSGYEFVWRVVDPDEVPPPPRFKPKKEVVGEEVGVNVDYGHLNNRRQNARAGKISRDIEKMKSFREAFREDEMRSKDRVGKVTRAIERVKSFRQPFRQDENDRDRKFTRARDQDQTRGRDRFARRDFETFRPT